MLYDKLSQHFRKHFYVVYFEKFKSETTSTYIERFMAKHLLLKPELIVVDDQIQGFRKSAVCHAGLERFPIYLEIEYSKEEDEIYINTVELYTEINVNQRKALTQIVNLANLYSKTITLEKVKEINGPNHGCFLIHSKLSDLIREDDLAYAGDDHGIASGVTPDVDLLLDVHFMSFANFLKLLDDIILNSEQTLAIEHLLNIL